MLNSNTKIQAMIAMPHKAACGGICCGQSIKWGLMMEAAQDGDRAVYRTLLLSIAVWLNDVFLANQMICQRERVLDSVLRAVHVKRHTFLPGSDFLDWLCAIALYRLAMRPEFKVEPVLRVISPPLALE